MWNGNVGVVTALLRNAAIDPDETSALICGPEIMMRFCVAELNRLGMEDTDIYVSMERNMKCATGFCGHCQYGPAFICKDGPVFPWPRMSPVMTIREL